MGKPVAPPNHDACFLLEMGEEFEVAGIQETPIEETVTNDNERADGSLASTL